MKWLRFLVLLSVVVAVGCSSAPSGSQEEAAPPPVDAADPAATEPATTAE
ncbi:MAG: hypothetical protein GXY83_05895 [Rhodopirellula sp.]|nr:hypothetical protein [Rhodopirellula sp.]